MRRRCAKAFSLVEVTLALGIASFALIAMLALLPVGIMLTGDSEDETRAAALLGELASDRETSPLNAPSLEYRIPAMRDAATLAPLPRPTAPAEFGVQDDGSYTTTMSDARYRVTTTFTPPAGGRADPFMVHFRVSWPASAPATAATAALETVVAIPSQ